MSVIVLGLIALLLAGANGANDNIKGAATLLGSGLVGYRQAITLATVATALGGLASLLLVGGLLAAFGGKGIVPPETATSLPFLASVGAAAAATVWLATRLGLPVSTTHALLGGLVGAGVATAPQQVQWSSLVHGMVLPLLTSPVAALLLAFAGIALVHWARRPRLLAATTAGTGVDAAGSANRGAVDHLHLFSAAAVSFARGLNDTPKIAALMVAGGIAAAPATLAIVAAMALGGWFAAARVADTLAFRVTRMDPSEGLGANLVTSTLVIAASQAGLPVSTTHVSTGALFGIAAESGAGHAKVIGNILLAWVATLPLAAALAYALVTVFYT